MLAEKWYSRHNRGSLHWLMYIHRLTDNDKVISWPKKINFRDWKFEKYHVFQNVRNTVSDNLVPPGDLLLRSRLVRLLLRSHLPVKKPGYGPEAYNTGLTRNDLPPRHHEWKTFSRCHFKQKWRDLESLLRQTVKRSRFRLRNSQNGNLPDKSSSEQFVWTKLAWIDWFPCIYNKYMRKFGHVLQIHAGHLP